jgi:hypothetical protein
MLPASVELDPFGAEFPSGSMAPDEGAHVQPGVTFPQPANDPPEREVIEVGEETLGYPVLKVGAPAPKYRVQPAQQVCQCSMR